MKKSIFMIAGLILLLTFTGCTRERSTSNAGNKPSEMPLTDAETESVTEKPIEQPTGEKSTVGHTKEDYNAEEAKKKFEESDLPDSIKNIFLSDGVFVDTVTQTEMKLSEYKLYEIIFDLKRSDKIVEWSYYLAVDFDGDGKKELFYDVKPQNSFYERVIFHEHTNGKVYAYRHPSTRESVSENGDVIGSGGADLTAQGLYRYSFDTERIISEQIVYAERQEDGGYKYYANGREVDLAEYETYFKHFWETCLEGSVFKITQDADRNQTSGK